MTLNRLPEGDLCDLANTVETTVGDETLQQAYAWPKDRCVVLVKKAQNFDGAYKNHKDDPIPQKTHIKNDAKDAFRTDYSDFANEFIRHNSKVPHDVKIKLCVAPGDEAKRVAPLSELGPESVILINGRAPATIGVRYLGPKPVRNCVCRIRWYIGPEAPASAGAMTAYEEESFGHNPWRHTFPNKRGQMFYYCLRWESVSGWTSEWSEVKSCAIP